MSPGVGSTQDSEAIHAIPKSIGDTMNNTAVVSNSQTPVIAGIEINTDEYGRFSLNAIHKASGSLPHKKPSQWTRRAEALELIDELTQGADLHLAPENQGRDLGLAPIESYHGGKHPGTFAHELLAISYAGWISPRFQLQVNQTFIDYRTGKLQRQVEQIEEQKALPTTLTPAQQRHIQKRAAELAHTPGNSFAQVYRSIKDKFSVGTYKDIASEKYPALCRFLQCEPLEGEVLPAEPATPIRPTTRLSYTESDLMNSGMVAEDGKFRRWANCGPTNNPLELLLRELNAAKYDKRAVMVDDIAGAVGVYNAMTSMIANDTELMFGLENRVTSMREASRSMVRLTL